MVKKLIDQMALFICNWLLFICFPIWGSLIVWYGELYTGFTSKKSWMIGKTWIFR